MNSVGTPNGLAGRTVLTSNEKVALAELRDGERETIDALIDHTFDPDPDDREVPYQVPTSRAALLDTATGELLGMVIWRPTPFVPMLSCTAWTIGMYLLPDARGRGIGGGGGLLLVEHLFATTGVDRVQALTEVDNVPGRRGLERAGFHREGVLRGVMKRDGKRRDMVSYSLLRSDLDGGS